MYIHKCLFVEPTEAELAVLARLREQGTRMEDQGAAAARPWEWPETEATRLVDLLLDLESEATLEQVSHRQDEVTSQWEAL